MSNLYGHKFELYIGRKESLIESSLPQTYVIPNGEESVPSSLRLLDERVNAVNEAGRLVGIGTGYQDYLVIPTGFLLITEHRMKARIIDSKSGKSNKNVTKIEVYNLSKSNQSFIKTDDTILLKAGYANNGELPLVYAGQVTKVTTRKVGQDTITTLLCGAGAVVRKNARFSKAPRRNETVKEVCEYFAGLCAMHGIPTGRIFVPIELPIYFGYPCEGQLFTEMEIFCDNYNLSAYVSLGKLYIEPIDITDISAVVQVNAENVKGSIRPQTDASGTTTGQEVTGLQFTTFLDGRISAAKKVEINYGDYSGDYKVTSVEFKMDSEANPSIWDTIVDCERLA